MTPKTMSTAACVLLNFSAVLISPSALAQDEVVDENIIVTGIRGERGKPPLPISATVLDQEEIALTSATSIDDLLRGGTGVQLPLSSSNYNFPANPSVAIRGLGLGDNGTRGA